MKHIIFEGENGTGKTTLINGIQAIMPGFLSHHFTFPFGNTNEQKAAFQEGQFRLMFDNLRPQQVNSQAFWKHNTRESI